MRDEPLSIDFFLHCHMRIHEEMGMMQTVEVYDDKEP